MSASNHAEHSNNGSESEQNYSNSGSFLSLEAVLAIISIDTDGFTFLEPRFDAETWYALTYLLTYGNLQSILEHRKIYGEFLKGFPGNNATNYPASHKLMVTRLMGEWLDARGGESISREEMDGVFNQIAKLIEPDTQQMIDDLLLIGTVPLITTGGVDGVAKAIALHLQISQKVDPRLRNLEFGQGNTTLLFDKNEQLIDFKHIPPVSFLKFEQILRFKNAVTRIKKAAGYNGKKIKGFAGGDGSSDLVAFAHMYGFYKEGPKPNGDAKMHSKKVVTSLLEIPPLVARELAL